MTGVEQLKRVRWAALLLAPVVAVTSVVAASVGVQTVLQLPLHFRLDVFAVEEGVGKDVRLIDAGSPDSNEHLVGFGLDSAIEGVAIGAARFETCRPAIRKRGRP